MPLKNLIEQGVRTGIGIAVDKLTKKTPFSITRFKEAVAKEGGLSRGVFFDCTIGRKFQTAFSKEDAVLLCKAANMPAAQLDTAEVKYFTRSVKIPASRQFSPLTLTFYNTQTYSLRHEFLTWLSEFNTPISNVRNAQDVKRRGDDVNTFRISGGGADNDQSGMLERYCNIILTTRDERHNERGFYQFNSAFPTSVGALSYSYENDSQVHTYDVEFQYLSATFTALSAIPNVVARTNAG